MNPLERGWRWLSRYGIGFVLLAVAGFFSVATWDVQHPTGAWAADVVAAEIERDASPGSRVLIVGRPGTDDEAFATALERRLPEAGYEVLGTTLGAPIDARRAVTAAVAAEEPPRVIACTASCADWPIWGALRDSDLQLGDLAVIAPSSYYWPNFLKTDNLLNLTNQITVIAILGIGMTLVILTGGIDLSVGSVLALSAVVSTLLIRDLAGGEAASTLAVVACCAAAVLLCGLVGAGTGLISTGFGVPPFLVTLAVMFIARGSAYLLSQGQSIHQTPAGFSWLGLGGDLGIPNAIVLMLVLYAIAYVVMSRTVFGRYVVAVGGNADAARLAGVPVGPTLVVVYMLCGALAGLGGVVAASQLGSGSAQFGLMYELYVIAAVVVGGTSLRGGEGDVLGTLLGALLLAVIQNGMNLTGISPYAQQVVLGSVLLAAVLLDVARHHDWWRRLLRRQG